MEDFLFLDEEINELNMKLPMTDMPYDKIYVGCEKINRVLFSMTMIGTPVRISRKKSIK